MSIYIGNLPYSVTEDDVKYIFSDYGSVKRVAIPTDRETGRMRGFGFVDFASEEEESKAIEALDGAEWMNRELRVNKAKERPGKRSNNYDRREVTNSFAQE